MECFGGEDGLLVVVDYVYMLDVLEQMLCVFVLIIEVCGGKLWVVFGCGGDCDFGKCLQMGVIVECLVLYVVLIFDNLCSEDLQYIFDEIVDGMDNLCVVIQIEDCVVVILYVVWYVDVYDVIVVVGKGYELMQEIVGCKWLFFDQEYVCFVFVVCGVNV